MKEATRIEVKGLVQGVGFRPFIYRLADRFGIKGTVENNNTGVIVIAEGNKQQLQQFVGAIQKDKPVASSISSIEEEKILVEGYDEFKIIKSTSFSDEITEVSPDIGVCDACLSDMKTQDHRIDYPFINCTNCGPRFTIIADLPYDRKMTTMREFEMCPRCRSEYTDILDRRFHAQPVACKHCGPHYSFHSPLGEINDLQKILTETSTLLEQGGIIAIKGLGGFHLACDPFNEESVDRLRNSKNREGKPFALMLKDLATARRYLYLNKEEEKLLTSWRKPIVLLKTKKAFAPSISIGLDTVGVMLPYMPFHYLLFEKTKLPALVMTSGNLSDEPIVIDNDEALGKFGDMTAAIVTYNRAIHNRVDDSVSFVAGGKSRIIRRSRSYAPTPVHLSLTTEGIFAAGAELVNCFCIGKGKQAILSQHIGDLKNLETLEFYEESVERYQRLFRFNPEIAVMDMHPDYLSSRFAQNMGIPVTAVQHHHAHIASCMAEHGLDEKVIGISLDGTGYGTDGRIWGGEFLFCDLNSFDRISHLEYIPQPGGDAVTHHPWRMMMAYLYHYFGKDSIDEYPFLFEGIEENEIETILFSLHNNVNCPLTSSTGRLFDAVSALVNVCRNTTYHAEAPMRLEAVADASEKGSYPFGEAGHISMKDTFTAIIEDIRRNVPVSSISGKFHNTVVEVILKQAEQINANTGIQKIVLSGGSFQNRILLEKSESRLSGKGFRVFTQAGFPSNDGGIALGQLAIAAKRRELGLL